MPNALFSGMPLEYPILRKDMFSVIFPPAMGISERFQVKAARPKVSQEAKELKYKNSITKYKGVSKFEDMQMVFRDVAGPAVMQKLWAWQRQHFDPVTGCGGYASQYKKNLTLVLEDDCANPLQKWILYGCFIVSLDGGDLDMDSNADSVTVSMTLAYDYADLEY